MDKPTLFSLTRTIAGVTNQYLQGKKRWVSLAGYLMLAIATVAGFDLGSLSKDLTLDPGVSKDSTLIALATAAGVTFRFFQNMGRTRDFGEAISRITDRLDKKGIR
jgi:uncharacterized membrane protein YbjE (DUF340 family)